MTIQLIKQRKEFLRVSISIYYFRIKETGQRIFPSHIIMLKCPRKLIGIGTVLKYRTNIIIDITDSTTILTEYELNYTLK